MKKLSFILSAALLAVVLAVCASAATCEHFWKETSRVSSACETKGSVTYECSRCGSTKTEEVDAHGHDMVETSATASTCTTKGEVVKVCSVCDKQVVEAVEVLGHDFAKVANKCKAATCTETGYDFYQCKRCGETKTEDVKVLGHDYSKFISTSATCSAAGQATYQCTRCGDVVLRSQKALGHNYEKSGGPTCTERGKYTYTCTRCKYSYSDSSNSAALGHILPDDDSSLWRTTVSATCDTDGSKRARCTRCNTYVYKTIAATNHDYSSDYYLILAPTSSKAGQYRVQCDDCGESVINTIKRGTTNLGLYKVPPVDASRESGIVAAGTTVELSCELEGVTIYYALGGKSPTSKSNRVEYTEPIAITGITTIRAYAVYDASEDVEESDIAKFTYIVKDSGTYLYLEDDASDGGYMSLETGKKFRPEDKATRYEVIDAMDNLFGSWAEDAELDLIDVDKEHRDAVAKFVGARLIDGYEDKTFRGDANIKRAELAKLLTLALGLDTDDVADTDFKDLKKTHWAYEYIAALTEKGYLQGDTVGNFRPEDNITRAELATVMNRVADIDSAKGVTITDVAKTHWAYGYICAAVK